MIKISLILIISGLPILAILSHLNTPDQDNLMLLSEQQDTIHLQGTLLEIRNKGDLTRATLNTCLKVPIMMFDPIPLDEGRQVSVVGRKETYQGQLQVVVDTLKYI